MIGKIIAALFFAIVLAFAAIGVLAIYLASDPPKDKDE